jgi:hypothetical protein
VAKRLDGKKHQQAATPYGFAAARQVKCVLPNANEQESAKFMRICFTRNPFIILELENWTDREQTNGQNHLKSSAEQCSFIRSRTISISVL